MIRARRDQPESPVDEEERDLKIVGVWVLVTVVAGGLFIFNSAIARDTTTASYVGGPALNTLPILTPTTGPKTPPTQ